MFLQKNNLIKLKTKLKFKKYQPLRYCIFNYSLMYLFISSQFLFSFKNNNALVNIQDVYIL